MVKDTQAVTIILVEDDDVDAQCIVRALKKLKIMNPVVRAYDGMDALSRLRGEGDNATINKPYVILLDINMPRMDGIEFLEVIRGDAVLRDSIVFVLTTSKAEQDRSAAFKNNVAGYIVKSGVNDGFQNALKMVEHYWRIVELPI